MIEVLQALEDVLDLVRQKIPFSSQVGDVTCCYWIRSKSFIQACHEISSSGLDEDLIAEVTGLIKSLASCETGKDNHFESYDPVLDQLLSYRKI